MCETRPGPRCSYDMSRRLNVRKKALQTTIAKHGEDSIEVKNAKAKLRLAYQDYCATPDGIKELNKEYDKTGDPKIQELLNKSILTRNLQTNAIDEIKNGRIEKIAKLYKNIVPTTNFSGEEIQSVIDNYREWNNLKEIHLGKTELENPETLYQTTLLHLENELKASGKLTDENKETLASLKAQKSPDSSHVIAYAGAERALYESKKQLKTELETIAALHGTTPVIAQEYYNAYRNQWNSQYSNVKPVDQPSPPENWLSGEFNNRGYRKQPETRFLPSDKASAYALMRLEADPNSIPDHMKQSKQYIAIETTPAGVHLTSYNSSGKKLSQKTYISGEKSAEQNIMQDLKGKIVISSKPIKSVPFINAENMFKKFFDTPSYTKTSVTNALKTKKENLNDAEQFFLTKQKIRLHWNSKQTRATAPVISI